MSICTLASPPAIVQQAEAELDKGQLTQGIINAATRDNFAVGRYALAWHKRYSRDCSDASIAFAVNQANPDAEVSEEYIRVCRNVAAVFPTRVGNLRWYHHRLALELDKKNARKWAEKADAKGWTCGQLRSAITRKITGNGAALEPQTHRAIKRTIRQLLSQDGKIGDPTFVRAVLHEHDAYIINHKPEFTRVAKRLKKSAELILHFMETHRVKK